MEVLVVNVVELQAGKLLADPGHGCYARGKLFHRDLIIFFLLDTSDDASFDYQRTPCCFLTIEGNTMFYDRYRGN